MRLQDIIPERIETRKKNPYAKGYDHVIYKSLKDSDKLFKVINDKDKHDIDWIKIFKDNPKYFPTIYRSNENGAEVEKLDVNKAGTELTKLENIFHREDAGNFRGLLDMIPTEPDGKLVGKTVREYHDYLSNNHPDLVVSFMRWVKLISDISKATHLDRLDIHAGNFGYDKQGHLKMIDI